MGIKSLFLNSQNIHTLLAGDSASTEKRGAFVVASRPLLATAERHNYFVTFKFFLRMLRNKFLLKPAIVNCHIISIANIVY